MRATLPRRSDSLPPRRSTSAVGRLVGDFVGPLRKDGPVLIPDASLPDLPIRAVLPQLRESLAAAGASVLVAPPGTGKTTLVPLALAGSPDGAVITGSPGRAVVTGSPGQAVVAGSPGRVVVAEPRRIAARAAARRMASLLGEPVGE